MTDTSTLATPEPTATVNEIIARHPATVSTFHTFGIDACCGGDSTLAEAARRDAADLNALIAALDAVIDRGRGVR